MHFNKSIRWCLCNAVLCVILVRRECIFFSFLYLQIELNWIHCCFDAVGLSSLDKYRILPCVLNGNSIWFTTLAVNLCWYSGRLFECVWLSFHFPNSPIFSFLVKLPKWCTFADWNGVKKSKWNVFVWVHLLKFLSASEVFYKCIQSINRNQCGFLTTVLTSQPP